MNPLRILPTEQLAARQREKQMRKDVDALAKRDTNPCRRNWYAGSGIQPKPEVRDRKSEIGKTAAGIIAIVIITLINCELAARCFDDPTNHQQLTQMENH